VEKAAITPELVPCLVAVIEEVLTDHSRPV
jgi:hypothetical protein